MLTATELYDREVRHLSLAERLRLTALLLDDLQAPATAPAELPKPRPKRGSGKEYILDIADDFDAPMDDMKDYTE